MYKIVAADSRSPRDGRFIEALGEYNPLVTPAHINLNEERALYWLSVGAQPTDTVKSLLSKKGVMLRVHLQRKGKSDTVIAEEMEKWGEAQKLRAARSMTKKQARAQRKKAATQTEAPAAA